MNPGNYAWVRHSKISTAKDGVTSYSHEIRLLEKVAGAKMDQLCLVFQIPDAHMIARFTDVWVVFSAILNPYLREAPPF